MAVAESRCTHNQVTPSGSVPVLLQCLTQPDIHCRLFLLLTLCLRSPQSFLLPIPISKLMVDSWQAKEETEWGAEESESQKWQKLLCVYMGNVFVHMRYILFCKSDKKLFINHRSVMLKGTLEINESNLLIFLMRKLRCEQRKEERKKQH